MSTHKLKHTPILPWMLTAHDVFRLREVSDVAKMQVVALEARQQSREKEVECLRRQVLDYQVRCAFVRRFVQEHL